MEIKVGMADMNVCCGSDSITTLGLGSCVGVILWDPSSKICGMLHAMLPDSTAIRNNANVAKFVDSGLDELLKRVIAKGADRKHLVAKIAGGAQMFSVQGNSPLIRVGERNVEASKLKLRKLQIPIRAEDTGGSCGRTVTFYPATGEYHIKNGRKTGEYYIRIWANEKEQIETVPAGIDAVGGGVTSIITFYFDYEIKTVLLILLSVLLVFYIAGLGIEAVMESFEKSIAAKEKEQIQKEGMVLEKEAETEETSDEEVGEETKAE